MKTLMEQSLECCVDIYHQYCYRNPMDDYLQLKELLKLMKEQAQPFLKDTTPEGMDQDTYITQIFNKADRNKDDKISFGEFLAILILLLNDAHNRSHDLEGSGHGHHGHGHGHDHGHSHSHDHGPGHSHSHGDGHGH